MFKKLKLKPYLLLVFACVILLAAMITALSAAGLLEIRKNMQDYIDNTLGAEAAVKTCRIEANVAARDLREMVITDNVDDYSKFIDQIYESQKTIKEQIALFKAAHGEEDGLAQKYDDAFQKWFLIAESVISQLEQGKKDNAADIILNQCSPALNTLVSIVKEIDQTITEEKLRAENFNELTIRFFIIASLSLFLVSLIISIIFAVRTTANIVLTTNRIKDAVIELSKGNLNIKINYEAENEFGELAERMNFSFEELSKYISAINYGMTEFAGGNFTCKCPVKFLGDFSHIQYSIEQFQVKMNDTLVELDTASSHVNAGAGQVAGAAQALAEGASEQAVSVEEVTASIAEISHQIFQTSDFAMTADSLGQQAREVVEKSRTEMKQMLQAIKDIAEASENIQQIVNVIHDIAFQTNVMALNAAVEAARAGSAGQGFAVVADAVRNLARKSAEAAKDTTALIESSLLRVENGKKLAVSTNAAFDEVAINAEKILDMVAKIAGASEDQASSISRISQSMNQISDVVQMNSATSEESAAASQELSGQAGIMKSLISQFQLIQRGTDKDTVL